MRLMVFLPLAVVSVMAFGIVFYLSGRFGLFFPAVPRRVWVWGLAALTVGGVVAMMSCSMSTGVVGVTAFRVGGVVCGVLILTLLAVAAVDLLNVFFRFAPHVRGLLTLGVALALVCYGVWDAYAIRVHEVVVPMRGLTGQVRALHVSDVHLGDFRGRGQVERLVRKIEKIAPDVIFNTGDMFDGKTHFAAGRDVLAPLRRVAVPHYFVYGNHDQWVGVRNVTGLMRAAGARVLENEVTRFRELQIVGLNNMPVDRQTYELHADAKGPTIAATLDSLPFDPALPTVVLHHRPDGVEYMEAHGAGLLLAGHTHAGQLFPLTIVARAMFRYNRGAHRHGEMTVHVSQGVGTIFTPMRLGTRGEMTVVRLVPVE